MLDIRNVESAYLGGTTKWTDFIDEFNQKFGAPVARSMAGAAIAAQPPEVKQNMSPQILREFGQEAQ